MNGCLQGLKRLAKNIDSTGKEMHSIIGDHLQVSFSSTWFFLLSIYSCPFDLFWSSVDIIQFLISVRHTFLFFICFHRIKESC